MNTTDTDLDRRTLVTTLVNRRNAALAKMREGVDSLVLGYQQAADACELEKPLFGIMTEMQMQNRAREQGNLLADETADPNKVVADPSYGTHLNDRTQEQAYSDLFRDFNAERSFDVYRKAMDTRIWLHFVSCMGISDMMDRTAKEKFKAELTQDVPEFTEDNVYAMFQHLMGDAKLIFQRGVARAFSELDRKFKSHDPYAFGNKGKNKSNGRIILTGLINQWGNWNWGGRAHDTLIDIERVFAVLDKQAPEPQALRQAIEKDRAGNFKPQRSVTETRYFKVNVFENGNAHLWFKRDDLLAKVNDVLAEYYGEVLPDAAEYDPNDPENVNLHSTTNALSKDLQFYPTPPAVTRSILSMMGTFLTPASKVLEPSAGTGNMVRHLLDLTTVGHITAVEVHPERASQIPTGNRTTVVCANFLGMPATPTFSHVVMNPPFYGTHWIEHVVHAWDFLKPGGELYAVLPVTAETGETKKHVAFRAWVTKAANNRYSRPFTDLPGESFASSGTRINTVVLHLRKPHT